MKINFCDISIIIVSYNTKDITLRCIRSIYHYTEKTSIEIIVIDNASRDGSVDAIRREFKEVLIIENKDNLGFSKANNIGIKQAKGEYICLVNSDIELIENTFDMMYEFMEKNPSIGVAGPKTVNKDQRISPNVKRLPTLWNCFCDSFFLSKALSRFPLFEGREVKNFNFNEQKNIEVLAGCFMLIRRQALNEVGLLDESFFFYGEDTDWCKRFGDNRWQIYYWPATTVIHLENASSKKENIRFLKELEKADLQYWKKYYNSFIVLVYIMLRLCYHALCALAWFVLSIFMPFNATSIWGKVKGRLVRLQFLLFQAPKI